MLYVCTKIKMIIIIIILLMAELPIIHTQGIGKVFIFPLFNSMLYLFLIFCTFPSLLDFLLGAKAFRTDSECAPIVWLFSTQSEYQI